MPCHGPCSCFAKVAFDATYVFGCVRVIRTDVKTVAAEASWWVTSSTGRRNWACRSFQDSARLWFSKHQPVGKVTFWTQQQLYATRPEALPPRMTVSNRVIALYREHDKETTGRGEPRLGSALHVTWRTVSCVTVPQTVDVSSLSDTHASLP
jgi:hypothetical protein